MSDPVSKHLKEAEILLGTLNSKYHHSSFGLRYIYANLDELQACTQMIEFTIKQKAPQIAEQILAANPRIVGLGVYIWNTVQTELVIDELRGLKPDLCIVLGGPEVSYESESQSICKKADYVIKGESDFLFRDFCREALLGNFPAEKFISGALPEVKLLKSPYSYYSDEDIKNRVIYVEASRGCPYKCEYCLSSLDKSVRNFPTDVFLSELDSLIQRGVRQFKFVDRTFNLSPSISSQIMEFFLARIDLGLFLHFEMVPDRLPEDLKAQILRFPPGSLQFEIGIQTWSTQVAFNVSRRQDYKKIEDNLKFLKEKSGVHTHADLIVGLPGETVESFAVGFNKLASLSPDEIQVGILKRLKGTPIIRHDDNFAMLYSAKPPFQIISNKDMSQEQMNEMVAFAKTWDLVANSGNFPKWYGEFKALQFDGDLFSAIKKLSEFLVSKVDHLHSLPLAKLFELIKEYSVSSLVMDEKLVIELLAEDYTAGGKRTLPRFLMQGPRAPETMIQKNALANPNSHLPERQRRHLGPTSQNKTPSLA